MRISVFGIGYVGTVSAACLARDGHKVVATDVNQDKVRMIATGSSPVVEPGLDALIRSAVQTGRLTATLDAMQAVLETDLSFVCVGTPSNPNGSLDTSFVTRVATDIGRVLHEKAAFHSVVIRSTVLPGTMAKVIIPALEAASAKRAGVDFGVGYLPEFLREGLAIADYDAPGAVVFGACDLTTETALRHLHARLPIEPKLIPIAAAETVKYANNAWHALKISFANEIGRIGKAVGVDSHDIMETLCLDTKLNVSTAYLTPGFAFGGSCLPKDVNALRHRARSLDVETPVLDAVMRGNQIQMEQAFVLVEAIGHRRVGLIGLSFKPDVDDLRSSPFVELAERLIGRGYVVRIFDPIVRLSRLTGTNSAFLRERLPHIAEILCEQPDTIVAHSETVIIGNRKVAAPLLAEIERNGTSVIDLVRVQREKRTGGNYHGLCW